MQDHCKRDSFHNVKRKPASRPTLIGLFVLVTTALFLTSCHSAPEEIPEGLSQMEMFQRAQEAVDQGRWDQGLRYYREFIARFPDERGAIMEAEYEIAFIAYKQADYETARTRFEAILATYEADQSQSLPEWPRVLSERLIEIIEERTAET